MSREDLHFRLRIPEDLKARVSEAAASNNRSMTAEIVARLEASFEPPDDDGPNPFERFAEEAAKAAAAEAAVIAIDAVLAAINAPEGTSDAERFQMLVRRSASGFEADDGRVKKILQKRKAELDGQTE